MVMDCEQPQLEPVRDAHLIEDVGEVTLDRVLADGEGVCDVHVRGARCDRSDDLQLTRRQSKRLALYRSPSALLKYLYEVTHALSSDPALAIAYGADSRSHIASGRVFQDHPARSQFHGFCQLLLFDASGQQNDTGAAWFAEQGPEHLQAGQTGHGYIEQQNVRLEAKDHFESIAAISGLANHLESRFRLQELAKADPHHRMIVGNQDLNFCLHAHS
jgi:hypothetical protein